MSRTSEPPSAYDALFGSSLISIVGASVRWNGVHVNAVARLDARSVAWTREHDGSAIPVEAKLELGDGNQLHGTVKFEGLNPPTVRLVRVWC